LRRITAGPDASKDLGPHLPHLGSVYRHFSEKTKDYTDEDVRDFIIQRGEPLDYYSTYCVVPKTLELATASIKRFDRPPYPVSPKIEHLYDIAASWIDRRYSPIMGDSRVMSYSEVIEYMPAGKSPGYPWSLKYAFKEDFASSPLGEAHLEDYWEKLATEDYYQSLCAAFVKEEVRSKVKIYDQKKARTVIAMPGDHVYSHCRLVLDQNRRLIQSHGRVGSELGINFFYGGAHLLVDRHQSFAGGTHKRCSMALDGVGFDGRYRKTVFQRVGKLRAGWLCRRDRTPDNVTRIRNIYKEVASAPIINVNGDVFGRDTGHPSGTGATTPDNGLKNEMDIFVLWMLLAPPDMCNYESFTENVLLSVNGDDINITVKEECHWFFNPESIMGKAEEIGMEYTCEFPHFVHFADLTFLGHGFRLVDLPELGHAMFLPVIDCQKMRSNALIYNQAQTPAMSIIRACGLRNETFACDSCRDWFADLISYLRVKYGASTKPEIKLAWMNYKTDKQLWELYSGFVAEGVFSGDASLQTSA